MSLILSSSYSPVIIAAGATVAALAYLRMQRVVQRLRIRMAECGETLLKDSNLTPAARNTVEWMLRTAFRSRAFLFFALVVTPFAAFVTLFGHPQGISDGLSAEARQTANRLNQLHTVVMYANHPILFPLVVLNALLWLAIAGVAKLLYGGAFPRGSFAGVDIVGGLLERSFRGHSIAAI